MNLDQLQYAHRFDNVSGSAIRAQKTKFDAACLPVLGITARYAPPGSNETQTGGTLTYNINVG